MYSAQNSSSCTDTDTDTDTATDTDRDMTFEEARKFVPRRQRETVKSYNERVRAYQAQQNSTINELKEEYERYRVQGEIINNARLQGLAAQYQQTEPEKYRETVQIAEEMLRDGILQDEIQAAMYVVQTMGGKVSDIFETETPSGSTSPMIDQILQTGQGPVDYNSVAEAEAANLRPGTRITINGRPAVVE